MRIRRSHAWYFWCFLLLSRSQFVVAQNNATTSTRCAPNSAPRELANAVPNAAPEVNNSAQSATPTPDVTRILDPKIAQRLRDDNVLVTADVQHADKTALQRAARSGAFPTYIVITRTLPHPYKSAFTMARDIRLQLDVSANAVVIVATEADGYLGINTFDIEYSMSKEIATRSALTWTQEGYAQGAAQTIRLMTAEREEMRRKRLNNLLAGAGGFLLFVVLVIVAWRRRQPDNKRGH